MGHLHPEDGGKKNLGTVQNGLYICNFPCLPGVHGKDTEFYWMNLLEDSHLGDQERYEDNIAMYFKEVRFCDEK